MKLTEAMQACTRAVEQALSDLAPEPAGPDARVWQAMRYSLLAGGKRLRPFLVMQSADLFAVPPEQAMRAAAAVEMVHTYSLIHDDLPCMDDDDLRRGMPTCHRQFDEATAVLAGDGLQALAFEVLMGPETDPDPAIRCQLALGLARSAGAPGMVGGQMIDLLAENTSYDLETITRLQAMKTGALITWSMAAGGVLGRATPAEQAGLTGFGEAIGIAFQIADDLLDMEGDAQSLGKAVRKDADAGKETFVSILGVEEARAKADELVDEAISSLDLFGKKADLLHDVARYIVARQN